MAEAHLLVLEGAACQQGQAILHLVRNLAKMQAHLVTALVSLAGEPMRAIPSLAPMTFRHGLEMPYSNEWEREVWPERFSNDAEAAD